MAAITMIMTTTIMAATIVTTTIRRSTAPVAGAGVVVRTGVVGDWLRQLILILRVLLAQRVVLTLQAATVGRCIKQRLLLRGFILLPVGGILVGLLLGLGYHPLLAHFHPLFVEGVDVVCVGVALGDIVLAQVEILIDDFAVVRLMQQFALAARAGVVGVRHLPVLRALVDVLRVRKLCSTQQQDDDAQKALCPGRSFHHGVHFAPTPHGNVDVENAALGLL